MISKNIFLHIENRTMKTNIHPDLQELQIPPPFNNSKEFEEFTVHLFNELHKSHKFQKRSRYGQAQDNHDVYNRQLGIYIECKLKYLFSREQSEIQAELENEITDYFHAVYRERKLNNLKEFYLLSTFHDDKHLQDIAKSLSKNNISVSYWGWEKIIEVFDLNGRRLISERVMQDDKALRIGALPSGLYMISITARDGTVLSRNKFVKE